MVELERAHFIELRVLMGSSNEVCLTLSSLGFANLKVSSQALLFLAAK